MAVRCKFKVTSIDKSVAHIWDGKENTEQVMTSVSLFPVSAKEGEDSIFGKATPNGSIRVGIVNEAVAQLFALGKAYYVDFSPAD